jgi:hypothetical protein
MDSWASKDAEFYVDFKNINLPLRQMHLKKVLSKKRELKYSLFICVVERINQFQTHHEKKIIKVLEYKV